MEASVIDSCTDTVAKYFYFSSLDEHVSFHASLKVLSELRANGHLDKEHRHRWIQTLTHWRARLPSLSGRSWTENSGDRGFELPPNFDMGGWMTFLSSTEASEVEAVLLSHILRFTDEEIARGLGVTEGTVRYRVGRGLRALGGYLES